jgi:hypothetical protein
VHGFLSLAGNYRKFIKEFGLIAAPLTALLYKEGFSWSTEAEVAFTALKTAVTTRPYSRCPISANLSSLSATPRCMG